MKNEIGCEGLEAQLIRSLVSKKCGTLVTRVLSKPVTDI